MKPLQIVLACSLPLLFCAFPAPNVDDSSGLDVQEDAAELDNDPSGSSKDAQIQKRSGSFDYVAHLKTGLLSSLGHASASIASGSSGGSSGGGGGGYPSQHDLGHHGNSVGYDPWSFKKSVLNTIFQAVKAITGGVAALKGQLIKGSGYALSAGGKLVAASGDKVTDVGKSIIRSAQVNTYPSHGHGHGHGDGGASLHPFAKFSSLSGASSGGSGGNKHPSPAGPIVHTETISTYEIPVSGHGSYGPPSKTPSYISATRPYLSSPPASVYAGAPFSGGHAAFEAPSSNYLPSSYGHDGHDDFNIYGRHKKLTDQEARKAAAQLQEILRLLPDGKTEYTASKTVSLDTSVLANGNELNTDTLEIYQPDNAGPSHPGPLASLSHTESITAAYAGPQASVPDDASDIYHEMAKKQLVEQIYIQKHPHEGLSNEPPPQFSSIFEKYPNPHALKGNGAAVTNLTPILAALEVVKQKGLAVNQPINTQYVIEKNVHKGRPAGSAGAPYRYLPPVVQQSKYTYFNPATSRIDPRSPPHSLSAERQQDARYRRLAAASGAQKIHHHAAQRVPSQTLTSPRHKRHKLSPHFQADDYQIQDSLLFDGFFLQ